MTTRIVHYLTMLFALTLMLPLEANADGAGYELSSTVQDYRLDTSLSTDGIRSAQSIETASGWSPVFTITSRYSDKTLLAIDEIAKSYVETTLSVRFREKADLVGRIAASFPPDAGRQPTAPGVMTRLSLTDSLDGVPLTAFSLRYGDQSWRLWVAESLPKLPPEIVTAREELLPVGTAYKAVLDEFLKFPLIRAEMERDAQWTRVFDTKSIRPITVKSSDFSLPSGLRRVESFDSTRKTLPPGALDVSASAIRGPGPVVGHPELYLILWGSELNDPQNKVGIELFVSHIGAMIKPAYTQYLAQYDVHSSVIKGRYYRPALPPRAVGSSNFAAISAIVYDVGFKDGTPIFWWEVGGHDPLYTILVAKDEVDSSQWDGYHFVAFSLTHAVLPFPVSLFAHDGIPWQISKVPSLALHVPAEADDQRGKCHQEAEGKVGISQPSLCPQLAAQDEATVDVSHEFVEATTDPYVPLGWLDPKKTPFYENGELADICQNSTGPLHGSSTTVAQTAVATYWSNADKACVPESGPSITLFEPGNGAILSGLEPKAYLRGVASDPTDGDLTDLITWVLDGKSVPGAGGNLPADMPTLGQHKVTAQVVNYGGLRSTTTQTFSVVASAPTMIIDSPTGLESFGTDEQIIFRGEAVSLASTPIPDSAVQWRIDDNVVGSGRTLASQIQTVGPHNVQLIARNSAGIEGLASIKILTTPPTGKPSPEITSPANESGLPIAYGQKTTAPLSLQYKMLNQTTMTPVSVAWSSNIDGDLGDGKNIRLSGGACAVTTHVITLTVKSPSNQVGKDSIKVEVGGIC